MRKICALLVSALALAACSDDDAPKTPALDGSVPALDGATPSSDANTDASVPVQPDGGALDCVLSPVTYLEILNACTDAEKVEKHPSLPLLLIDGGLPPLP